MSSLEISRRLTFFSFSQHSKSALEYSFFCCEEVNEEEDNKEDNKEQNANERNGKEGRKNSRVLFLSLPNNSASVYLFDTFLFFPTRRDLHLREKRRTWAKTRRKGRRPRLPPPLRRFRRQKRRVLRRRRATIQTTTANL